MNPCKSLKCNEFHYPYGMMMPNRSEEDGSDYRYSFQGQEKDDEIKGDGNSVNYKYRMHDPRVGRFFAVDPLASKYPHNGPYNFSENIVIHGIELEGLEVVIIFGGGDLNGTVGNPDAGATTTALANDVQDQSKPGTQVVLMNSNYLSTVEVIAAAQEEIMANYDPSEPVIIYGYSKGGEYATLLAEQLKANGINVELLVTVDAADGPFTFSVDREIPDNVEQNLNFYQDNGSNLFSEGDPNTAEDSEKTEIINVDMTDGTYEDKDGNSKPVTHGSMDEATREKSTKALVNATYGEKVDKSDYSSKAAGKSATKVTKR